MTLLNLLATLYPDSTDIKRVLLDAGIDNKKYNYNGSALSVWSGILDNLVFNPNDVAEIVAVASTESGNQTKLIKAYLDWIEVSFKQEDSDSSYDMERGILAIIQSDLKTIRKDLDELRISSYVRMAELTTNVEQIDKDLTNLHKKLEILTQSSQNDARNARIILYSIVISIGVLIVLYIIANLGNLVI